MNKPECKNLSFLDCELAIVRNAVDKAEKIQGKKKVNSEEIQNILNILEKYLEEKKLLIYGGTAINNLLPPNEQFYNKNSELPDYDFYSPRALEDAKELSNIYYANGYDDVEAKSGIHVGTFKVYVNFLAIADITYMDPKLFKVLQKKAIVIDKIYYTPPNFLRMNMYKELSRPDGDVSRWEKIFKRLVIFNRNYPLSLDKKCANENIIQY